MQRFRCEGKDGASCCLFSFPYYIFQAFLLGEMPSLMNEGELIFYPLKGFFFFFLIALHFTDALVLYILKD